MKSKTVWLMVAALALALAAIVPVLRAGTLETQVIALFPKDVGEFGYVDMKGAQKYKWFPQLEQQIMPARFRQFETFLKSAGIDPNTQLEDLAFAAIPANDKHPEEALGVAEGEFQPDTTEAYPKKRKLPTRTPQGHTPKACAAAGTGR